MHTLIFICMTPETAVSSRILSFFLLLNLESVLLCCLAMSDQSQLSSSPQQVKIYLFIYVYISIYIVICLDDFQIILVITWYFVYLFLLEISIFSYLLFEDIVFQSLIQNDFWFAQYSIVLFSCLIWHIFLWWSGVNCHLSKWWSISDLKW